MKAIRSLVDNPFNPDHSVVVYGLRVNEGETLNIRVDWLLPQILDLSVHPKFYEKTDDRSDSKPGVVKIEFNTNGTKLQYLGQNISA